MTAEEFLNDDLKGTHQTHDETGVILINGIEHSEVCRIMEDFARRKMTELMEEKIILQNDGEKIAISNILKKTMIGK